MIKFSKSWNVTLYYLQLFCDELKGLKTSLLLLLSAFLFNFFLSHDEKWFNAKKSILNIFLCSLALQQHRMALQKQKRNQEAREQQQQSPRSRKSSAASLLCAKKTNKRKRQNSPFKRDKSDTPPYEEMSLYYPQSSQKRPLILVGPPSIGRHELRQRLLDDTSKFAAPVPRKRKFLFVTLFYNSIKIILFWIQILNSIFRYITS